MVGWINCPREEIQWAFDNDDFSKLPNIQIADGGQQTRAIKDRMESDASFRAMRNMPNLRPSIEVYCGNELTFAQKATVSSQSF